MRETRTAEDVVQPEPAQPEELAVMRELDALIQADLRNWSLHMFGSGPRNLVDEARSRGPTVNANDFATVVHGREGRDDNASGAADSVGLHARTVPAARRVSRNEPSPCMRRRTAAERGVAPPRDDPSECSICLVMFEPGQTLKQAPCPGGHLFHKSCAERWFQDHGTCPLCRADLTQGSVARRLHAERAGARRRER